MFLPRLKLEVAHFDGLRHLFDLIPILPLLLPLLGFPSFLFGIEVLVFDIDPRGHIRTHFDLGLPLLLSIFSVLNHFFIFALAFLLCNDIFRIKRLQVFVITFLHTMIIHFPRYLWFWPYKLRFCRRAITTRLRWLSLLFLGLDHAAGGLIIPNSLILSEILTSCGPVIKLRLLVDPWNHSIVQFRLDQCPNIFVSVEWFHPPVFPSISHQSRIRKWRLRNFTIRNNQSNFYAHIRRENLPPIDPSQLNAELINFELILTHIAEVHVTHIFQLFLFYFIIHFLYQWETRKMRIILHQ